MSKKVTNKARRGRPPTGNVKMTFKLSPRITIALEKARDITGQGKSQIVEAALVAYLHLD
jgi:hypothetical protein